MGNLTLDLIRNSVTGPTGTNGARLNGLTKQVEPEWMQRRRNGYRPVTAEVAQAAAPITPATPIEALAARMRAGEFSIPVADALIGLLDVPQNTKKTGESIMLYALRRATPSGSGNDITYFEVKSFYSRAKGKIVRRIRQLIGAPGDWRRENLPVRMQCLALFHILENQEAAAHLFADTAASCYRCGSPLTNAKSRARRMGDDCASKS